MLCTADGLCFTMGDSSSGKLGQGVQEGLKWEPRAVGLQDCVAVAAGDYHTLALRSNGKVYSWGESYGGRLGDCGSVC